jgi:phosphopantetheinyl transferase
MTDRRIRPPVFVALMESAELVLDRCAAARRRAGRRLAHAVLRLAFGTSGWVIETEPGGRPWAHHPRMGSRAALSIAHTGSLVAAAVCGRGEVGIDVERRARHRDHRGIARLAFGRSEQRIVDRGGVAAFYRIWTLREAMSKATGEGLVMVMDAVDRLPAHPRTGHWVAADSRWLLAHLEPLPDVSLALAVRTREPVDADHWMPRCYRWANQLDAVDPPRP